MNALPSTLLVNAMVPYLAYKQPRPKKPPPPIQPFPIYPVLADTKIYAYNGKVFFRR